MSHYHIPVLLNEVIDNLITDKDGCYLDATLGGGGHTKAILDSISKKGTVVALDRDNCAIEYNQKIEQADKRLLLKKTSFSNLNKGLELSFDGILFDLGVSSYQLDESSRGFGRGGDATLKEVSLDMRMDNSSPYSAYHYLLETTSRQIAKDLNINSDISFGIALKIAHFLKENIDQNPKMSLITEAILASFPKGIPDLNRMFSRVCQAIRIEVNDEKKEIELGIEGAVKHLKQNGRLCIISFHSVEDRWVKKKLKEYEQECICPSNYPVCQCGGKCRLLKKKYKKPILPSLQEVSKNSRSRSSKLRVLEKVTA